MNPNELLLLQISTPILVGLAIIEFITGVLYQQPRYTWKDTVENVWTAIIYYPLVLLTRGVGLGFFLWLYQFRLIEIENPIVYWTILIVIGDLCFWTMHWVAHQVRLFWATHAIHHSSLEMNLSLGLRADYWQAFTKFFYYSPLIFLGFHGEDILVAYLVTLTYGTLLHTEAFPLDKLRWLEWILVTPSMHRVHHGSNPQYLDKNMGMIFSFWDHLFGTYQAEDPNDPIVYGLVGQKDHAMPFEIITHEFTAIKADLVSQPLTFRQKLNYIFGAPGWSHDGSRKTAKILQSELLEKKLNS